MRLIPKITKMATTTTTRFLNRLIKCRQFRQFSNDVKFHEQSSRRLRLVAFGACGVCAGGATLWLKNQGFFGSTNVALPNTVLALEPKKVSTLQQYSH